MVNSAFKIRIEMKFRSDEIALEVHDHWEYVMRALTTTSCSTWLDRAFLRKQKLLPQDGELITPTKLGNKLVLDITFPALFWRDRWGLFGRMFGDMVTEVALQRGLSAKSHAMPADKAAHEVTMELQWHALQFQNRKPLFYQHLKKTYR
jgi:hypothetical protein